MPRLVVPILFAPLFSFALLIEQAVVRQHQVRAIRDQQVFARHGDPLREQAVDLLRNRDWINDHAIADDAHFARTQDAGGNQMKNIFLSLCDDGMTGVVAALGADDDIGVLGQKIDDFAFAFVAPLSADEDGIGHVVG